MSGRRSVHIGRWAKGPLFAAALLFLLHSAAAAPTPPEAYLVRLAGPISGASAKAVERRLEKAREDGVGTVILELDTPGGDLWACIDLADFIFRMDDVRVIAYINDQAYSGGTMAALACDEMYIDAATGKMGDVAPVSAGGEIVGEKFQAPTRTTMLNYARARGYPEALVKAMVTPEIEAYRLKTHDDPAWQYLTGNQLHDWTAEERAAIQEKELIVPAGQLLAMHAEEAVDYGFARKAVRSPAELYDTLELEPKSVQRLYLTASERLLSVLDMFSPLLIVGGFILLWMEISHPGFGLPGIMAIGCFVAFFFIKWSLNYAHMLEVLLFLAGVVLVLLEVFVIPGFGVAGISGIALLIISLVLAFQQFTIPHTPLEFRAFQFSVLKTLGALMVSAVGIAILVRMLPSMPLFGRIVHRADLSRATASEALETRSPELSGMVGEVGRALTPLRPAGRAEFHGEPFDVVTVGDYVDRDREVQVQEIHGNRIVVTPYRPT